MGIGKLRQNFAIWYLFPKHFTPVALTVDSEHFISMCNMYAVMQGNTEFFKQTHYLALCDKCEFVIGLCHDKAHRADEAEKCMTNPPTADEKLQKKLDELEGIIGHIHGRELLDLEKKQ